MDQQTRALASSLPHLAELFEAADGDRRVEWKIVRWEGTLPRRVRPDEVSPVQPGSEGVPEFVNSFPSKTAALRFNAEWIRGRYSKDQRDEKNHWGVWRVRDSGREFYQTVIPTLAEDAQALAHKSSSVGPSAGTAVQRIAISPKAHRLLCRIAGEDERSLEAVLEDAVAEYDRLRFFARADEAYTRLRADAGLWAQELQERREMDAMLRDDVDEREEWDPVSRTPRLAACATNA